MDFHEYQKLAYKTANTNRQAVRDRIDNLPVVLIYSVFETIMRSGEKAGKLKGHLFYGRELKNSELKRNQVEKDKIIERLNYIKPDLIHSILGMADELAEIVSAVTAYVYDGKPLDYENIKEEYGDLLWFWSCGNTAIGFKNEDVADKNIEKLRKRFGEKFSEEKANNRDLESERKVFEK